MPIHVCGSGQTECILPFRGGRRLIAKSRKARTRGLLARTRPYRWDLPSSSVAFSCLPCGSPDAGWNSAWSGVLFHLPLQKGSDAVAIHERLSDLSAAFTNACEADVAILLELVGSRY